MRLEPEPVYKSTYIRTLAKPSTINCLHNSYHVMADTLDIEELNRTRVALGMAPLPVPGSNNLAFKTSSNGAKPDEDMGSTLESREAEGFDNYKRVQEEADAKKKKDAQRLALKKARDAAQRFAKLEGKGLGDADADGDMDARAWLLSGKKRAKKIEKARAAALERELLERENAAQYTERDLAGLKVGHELDDFDDETEHIVTLKDRAVDADDNEDDVLESADLRSREDLAKRLELKKKKQVYDPNDVDESEEKTILGQYDEEIKGKKQKKFTLGSMGRTVEESRDAATDDNTRGLGTKFSLDFLEDNTKPTSDYMDMSEIKVKKPKKKNDKAKRKRDDDEDGGAADTATGAFPMDISRPTEESAAPSRSRFTENFADDDDLQAQLALQRRTALKKRKLTRPEEIARQLREEQEDSQSPSAMKLEEAEDEPGLIIDETSEFVSKLQKPSAPAPRAERTAKTADTRGVPSASADPTDGDTTMAHTDDHSDDSDEDMDDATVLAKREDNTLPPEETLTATGLAEEETLTNGIGNTLKMLTSRGLLHTNADGSSNASFRDRQRFLQEKQKRETEASSKARIQRERDRASGKFERMSAREREQYAQHENKARDQAESRALADVFNKEYKPDVELKYVDEYGRRMNQREAFKHLSHQFHGKGSGKQKTEKRMKKIEDEKKREGMSSLDASQGMTMTGMERAMGREAGKRKMAGVRLQ